MFNHVSSGTIHLSGTSYVESPSWSWTSEGGLVLSGETIVTSPDWSWDSKGNISVFGNHSTLVELSHESVSGVSISGSHLLTVDRDYVSAGSASVAGSHPLTVDRNYTSAGSIGLTGVHDYTVDYNFDSTGSTGLSGAHEHTVDYNFDSTGSTGLSGAHEHTVDYNFNSSGAVSLSGNSGIGVDYFIDQSFTWDVLADIDIQVNFTWEAGDLPYHYWRVESDRIDPNCDNAGFSSPEPGLTNGQTYTQIVVARTLGDVCEALQNDFLTQSFSWPVKKIQKYSRPVYQDDIAAQEALGIDHSCLTLIDQEFCTIPDCLNLCIDSTGLTRIKANVFIQETFFTHVSSGTVNISGGHEAQSSYISQGSIELSGVHHVVSSAWSFVSGGSVVLSGSHPRKSSQWHHTSSGVVVLDSQNINRLTYDYTSSGSLSLAGSHNAFFDFANLITKVKADSFIQNIEYYIDEYEPEDTLTRNISELSIPCGCNPVPYNLSLKFNLSQNNKLSTFLLRNSLTLEDVVVLNYSSGVWRKTVHLSGISEDGVTNEKWLILFEWACQTDFVNFDGTVPKWKFSVHVSSHNQETLVRETTRLYYLFDSSGFCVNDNIDCTFKLNAKSGLLLDSSNPIFVEIFTFSDGVGLFRNPYWSENPIIEFTITELEIENFGNRVDLTHFLPS